MANLKNRLQNLTSQFHWYNFSWQVVSFGVSGLLVIVFYIFLAREWPKVEFGLLSTVLIWQSIYTIAMELGLDFWTTRQTSLHKYKGFPLNVAVFRGISGFVIGGIFIALAWWQSLPVFEFVVFTVGSYLLSIVRYFSCFLRGIERLSIEARLGALQIFLFIGTSVAGVLMDKGMLWIALSYSGSALFLCLATWLALVKNKFCFSSSTVAILDILRNSLKIWFCALLLGLNVKLDIIVLGLLTDQEEVAVYTAAARFFEGGMLLSSAFVMTVLPVMAQSFDKTPGLFYGIIVKYARLLALLTVMASLAGIKFGQLFFVALFGEAYLQSLYIFYVMMLLLPVSSMIVFLQQALIINGRFRPLILLHLFCILVSLALSYYFIPIWGGEGLLASSIIREMSILLGAIYLCKSLKVRESLPV